MESELLRVVESVDKILRVVEAVEASAGEM
jgi:hypothetical protein